MTGLRQLIFLLLVALVQAGWPGWAIADTLLPSTWQSQHFADHPLIGRIFNDNAKPVSDGELLAQARKAHFLLLGENHDNPDHHVIQSNVIATIASDENKPSVVFEMVPQRLSSEIRQYDLQTDPQLDDFAKRLEWEERGWYSWGIYRPIGLAAARNGLSMVAGNLDRKVTRNISKNGINALSEEDQTAFGLQSPLPSSLEDGLIEELKQSHCDLLPERALPSMVNVQRAKDGSMADAMIRSGQDTGAILIAGNGHVRKDRGVPLVLRKRLSEEHKKILASLLKHLIVSNT